MIIMRSKREALQGPAAAAALELRLIGSSMRYIGVFLLGIATVACRPDPTGGTAATIDVHGERWSELVGDALKASVRIEPVRRDEDLIFQIHLAHGMWLNNPAAHFEPDEIRARALIAGKAIPADSVGVLGNVDEITEIEIAFKAATIDGCDRSAPFELLLEVRNAVLLERWVRDK